MVAKLEAQGHPVYYFENTEGGHGSGAVNKQTAHGHGAAVLVSVDDAALTFRSASKWREQENP